MSKTPHYDLYALQISGRVKKLCKLLRLDLGDDMASMVLRTPSFVKQIREEDSTHVLEGHGELSETGQGILKALVASEEAKRLMSIVQDGEFGFRTDLIEAVALRLGLDELLFVGSAEEPTGRVLQGAMFAVFGAVFIRHGELEAKRLSYRLFKGQIHVPMALEGNRLPLPEASEGVETSIPSIRKGIRRFDWKRMKIVLEWAYLVHWVLFLILILAYDIPLLMGRILIPEVLILIAFIALQKTKQPRHVFASWVLFLFMGLLLTTPAFTMTTIKYGYIPVFGELDLKAMNRYPQGKYRLMTDVRLRDYRNHENDTEDVCFIEETIEAFDGNGHTIFNVQVPLFCNIKDVRNLSLRDVDFLESEHRGPQVDLSMSGPLGRLNIGIIENVHVYGTMFNVDRVGGLVGRNNGTIRLSSFVGDIIGEDWLGGLVYTNHGSIETSYSAGFIHGTEYLGGLVALNSGSILDSYSDVDIQGDLFIGGILASHVSTVYESRLERLLVFGSIEGESVGIIGPTEHPTMEAVYFAGKIVSTSYVPEPYAYFGQSQTFDIPYGRGPHYSMSMRIAFFRDTVGLKYAVWEIYRDGNPEVRGNPYWIFKDGL